MGNPSIPSAETISAEDFNAYLTNYEDCIKTISASKACKSTLLRSDSQERITQSST